MLPDEGVPYAGRVFVGPLPPPDEDPDEGQMALVRVNRKWIPYILGACSTLRHRSTWDTSDSDLILLTQYRVNNLLNLFVNPLEEPPFYDSDETADNDALPPAPWYENLSDWIIEAFLATTFTPGAAIVYSTTIPRIRLAFRTGDLGAIVRVLIDDIQIWLGDTNAPTVGLLEQELDVASFASEHALGDPPWELKIVHGGAPLGFLGPMEAEPQLKLEVELGDIRPREASVQLRQSGCVLQQSTDGVNWTGLFDPTSCIDGIVDTTIQDRINDGTLQRGGTQAGPQAPPTEGQCRIYHVALSGRDRWHSPSPVSSGDTILISNPVGGWYDGSTFWRCPDGSNYVLGACDTNAKTHVSGDPLNPGAYHMALIGLIGATYFDPLTAVYVVPAGTVASDFFIQANDGSLSDNQGTVEFDVQVCSAVTWCYVWDFTASNGAFSVVGSNHGVYVAGQGWNGTNFGVNDNPVLTVELAGSSMLATHVEMVYNKSAGAGTDNNARIYLYQGTTQQYATPNFSDVGTDITKALDITPVSCNKVRVDLNNGTAGGTNRLKYLLLRGRGVNPYGGNNCT